MSKNIGHIQHVKSSVVENGKPKLPQTNVLVDGELAINYAEGYETISLKNSSGNIVTFSSDEYYTKQKLGSGFTGENSANTITQVIEENEIVFSSAVNELNDRKLDASAYTPVTVDQAINHSTSASTNAVSTSAVYDFVTSYAPSITVDQVLDSTTSASTNPVASKAVYERFAENEETWALAFNQLNSSLSGKSDTGHTHVASDVTDLGTAAKKGVSNGISNTDNLIESKHIYSGVGVTVAYDSSTHYIQLKSTSGNVLSSFDASAFLVDGMVDSVTLEPKSGTTYLVITWNTAASKTKTELNIGDIFEADNYLTKTQLTATTDYTTVTKANSANTVPLSGVADADDLKAIEELTGTSGLLKKTATNTWTLDTTSYSSATQVNTALNGKSDTGHTHSQYASTAHTHSISDVTNLQTTLDGKSGTAHTHSNYSLTSHTHSQYSQTGHSHAISDVTNLQTTLDGKSGTAHTHSNYSLTSHTHSQYASTAHTHYWANLQVGSAANYVTEPEIKSVKINGSSSNAASTNNCHIQYDTTNKCLKFIFN